MALVCSKCRTELPRPVRFCSQCGHAMNDEPEFRRWLIHVYKRQLVFCAVAIPVGLLFLGISRPTTIIVSGLGTLGFIVSLLRLKRISAV